MRTLILLKKPNFYLVSAATSIDVVDWFTVGDVFNAEIIHETIAPITPNLGHVKRTTVIVLQLNLQLFHFALVILDGTERLQERIFGVSLVSITAKGLGISENSKTGNNQLKHCFILFYRRKNVPSCSQLFYLLLTDILSLMSNTSLELVYKQVW